MKKKILFVITKSNWGGAQRYVFDLASSLPQEEFEAVVALGGTGEKDAVPGMLEQKLKEKNIPTLFVGSFMRDLSFAKEFKVAGELKKIFKDEKPDVVHLNSSKAGGLGAWAARRAGVKKIVFTSHGLAYDEDRNALAKAGIWLATWLTFLLCHDVIVISKDNERRAKKLPFCSKKIRLVHNGIRPADYMEREAARAALSPKMVPLPQSEVWIGAVANLEWNKGLHYLVRAADELKRKGVDFALCIIGEGNERIFLETMIADEELKDRVYLAGFVEQAARYLNAFDVFALSSSKEGLPYVLMEAGAAGLACVASDIPGVKDIIEDKVSGFLFKTKNHSDLAQKLRDVLQNPALRAQAGEALKKRIAEEFSVEHMTEQTKKVYLD